MKRPRPYIPLDVRVQVALRQMIAMGRQPRAPVSSLPLGAQLREYLYMIGFEKPQLDHDPALILRKFNPRSGLYTPRANDPEFLIYRESAPGKNDHLHKTTGRKPDAEKTVTTKGSDIWQKAKFDRLEGRTKKKKSRPIAQRKNPWPKGRGFQR